MEQPDKTLIEQLRARGLIAQASAGEPLEVHLNKCIVAYCGFDPTAESLHIGHLVPLLVLRRFQMAGHKPIALIGGATGMIGDPSFKDNERQLLSESQIFEWGEKIKDQICRFVDFDGIENKALVLNNLEWVKTLSALDFLRDVGKYFSVNNMISKESVKQRIDREGSGISFTEFAYSLLQSYDFSELFRRYGCSVQIGGSDQWGNIVSGINLCRRHHRADCFGLTVPLITRSDGKKFGKTESGTIWLDARKTSPYAFYQFWLNTSDDDVHQFLRIFTFMPLDEIESIVERDSNSLERPKGQKVLARELTRLVHGDDGFDAARQITELLFTGQISALTENDFIQLLRDGMPSSPLADASKPLTQSLVDCGLAHSGREVKDALNRGAVFVNGEAKHTEDNLQASGIFASEKAFFAKYFLIRLGKKRYHLFYLA